MRNHPPSLNFRFRSNGRHPVKKRLFSTSVLRGFLLTWVFFPVSASSTGTVIKLRPLADRPNIVWVMSDEQRPDSLGCYGSAWAKTAFLDRLASEGALLEQAYSPSPVCVPARSALLTGRYGSSLGVLHNEARLRPDTQFLTWIFEEAGYQTASFGKKHYFYPGDRQAFQVERGRATDDVVSATQYLRIPIPEDCQTIHYPGPQPWILGGCFNGTEEETAERRNIALAQEWLSSLPPEQPFFVRLSLNAPHTPVVVPRRFRNWIDIDSIQLPLPDEQKLQGQPPYLRSALRDYQGTYRLSHEQVLQLRQYYYSRVSFLDTELERFFEWMRTKELLRNTIVVYTSDHGTELGEHGLVQKQTFYEQVVRVPYFFWGPGRIRAGVRLRNPVKTLSLMPTLLDLAGLKVPEFAQALSLARNLQSGEEPETSPVFSEIKFGYRGYRDDDRLVMIRDGRYKLILFQDPHDPEKFTGREEGALYDLENDPSEYRNLFSFGSYQSLVDHLRHKIWQWDLRRGSGTPSGRVK